MFCGCVSGGRVSGGGVHGGDSGGVSGGGVRGGDSGGVSGGGVGGRGGCGGSLRFHRSRLPLMSGDAYLAEMDASTAKYTPSPYTLPANILNLLVKIYTYIPSSKETTV